MNYKNMKQKNNSMCSHAGILYTILERFIELSDGITVTLLKFLRTFSMLTATKLELLKDII